MRILRIANIVDNRTGGMSRYIHFVSDILRADGHTVDHIFSEHLRAGQPGGRVSRFTIPVRVVRLVQERERRGDRYDVVEVHEPIAAAYALARRLSHRLPPLLVSVYALEARAYQARVQYGNKKGTPTGLLSRFGTLSIVAQANFALRHADHVCVETVEDADYLRYRFGIPEKRVTIQQGGVLPTFFAEQMESRNGVLFVGSWIERKGILELVPAITKILELHPGTPITLAGCGFSAEHVLASFPDSARSQVRVIPEITDDAILAELYRTHAVFAFPSTFEGLPLALLEAAAAGLAIVTTRTCGMRDVIREGETGLLVAVGDLAGFTAVLAGLVADPKRASRLGRAAQASMREYTWQRSAQQFLHGAQTAAIRRSRSLR